MKYLECRKIIEKNDLELSISMEIAGCVCASINCIGKNNVSDEMFEAICGYVRAIWDDVEKTYTQLMTDVVVDCIYHCFEYYQCKDITLGYSDLITYNLLYEVEKIYLEKYYD